MTQKEFQEIIETAAALNGNGTCNSTGYFNGSEGRAFDIWKTIDTDQNEYYTIHVVYPNGNCQWEYTESLDENELKNILLPLAGIDEEVVDESVKEMFPDWKKLKSDKWSKHGRILKTTEGDTVEIGLYREPDDNDKYAGTLTLQIFLNDEVVVCKQVSDKHP